MNDGINSLLQEGRLNILNLSLAMAGWLGVEGIKRLGTWDSVSSMDLDEKWENAYAVGKPLYGLVRGLKSLGGRRDSRLSWLAYASSGTRTPSGLTRSKAITSSNFLPLSFRVLD